MAGSSVLVAAVLPLMAVIAVNAFDDNLDPTVATYGEPRLVTVPAADNGYYAMLAMSAGDGTDGMAHAKAWIVESRAAAKENRVEKQAQPKRAKRPDLCESTHAPCLARA